MKSRKSLEFGKKSMQLIALFILVMASVCNDGNVSANTIGRTFDIKSSSIADGTVFVAPGATGIGTVDSPCSYTSAFENAEPGDVILLRGGTYTVSSLKITPVGGISSLVNGGIYDGAAIHGDASAPITIESYPGEKAIFDGGYDEIKINQELSLGHYPSRCGLMLFGDYYIIRNIEIKRMGGNGLAVRSSHNIIEGVETHHNFLSGIKLAAIKDNSSMKNSCIGNVIRDVYAHDNSDTVVHLENRNSTYKGGNQGDGINNVSAINTIIKNCEVAYNSDDGVDSYPPLSGYLRFDLKSTLILSIT